MAPGQSTRGRRAAVVLVVAAAAVAGLTLALGDDSEPPTAPEPSSSPTEQPVAGPRLGPDGLEALALGEPVDPDLWSVSIENGCNRSLSGLTDELRALGVGTNVRVETDGDDVVAVTLVERSTSVTAPGALPDVWLGPTLGDPIAEALALPGARVVTEDPR
ncbi:hypothetical protein [Aquipuribacter nitratireducens]|uniref:LytR/CpsA/Psr regulator C-terminal domain-containing protein n=1 Tax=Aquipuribacter nitratireducens TaxID=650104 RepID=A0ABW0GJU6_9MICO